jgi:hypothetical protein
MFKIKNVRMTFLMSLAFVLLALPFAIKTSFALPGMETLDVNAVDGKTAIMSTSIVEVDNMTPEDLFDFVTNIENDLLYYPGIQDVELLVEGDEDLVGTLYLQSGEFMGFPFVTTINITHGKYGKYVVLRGESAGLSYVAEYHFHKHGQNGAIFQTTSIVNGYGLSPETQIQYQQFSYNQMLTVLGKTGTVNVPFATQVGRL